MDAIPPTFTGSENEWLTYQEWLTGDDPVLAKLAANRIAFDPTQDRPPPAAIPEPVQPPERTAQPQPVIPLPESIAAHRLIRLCQFRSTTGCGCSGARCALRGSLVNHRDCLECAKRYGDS